MTRFACAVLISLAIVAAACSTDPDVAYQKVDVNQIDSIVARDDRATIHVSCTSWCSSDVHGRTDIARSGDTLILRLYSKRYEDAACLPALAHYAVAVDISLHGSTSTPIRFLSVYREPLDTVITKGG